MSYFTSFPRRFVSVSASMLVAAALSACAPMGTQMSSAPYPSGGYPQGTPQGAYPTGSYPIGNYPASTYPAQNQQGSYPMQNQQGNYTEYGRVNNIEVLQTQGKAQGSGVGALIGGVAGAVVGRQIGGGSGRDVATVLGAVGGAVAGNAVEKNRAGEFAESFRISVQLDNGNIRAYDMPTSGQFRIGDRVRIENGQLFRM